MINNLIRYQSATGKELAMHEFLPGGEARPKAGMVIVHGLGDYVMRYADTAEPLTELGIAVIGVDLPGHGESEGKRGHVGRLSDVHTVIEEARGCLREIVEPVGGKIGALAHSAGGLLLFEYLTRFPGNFAFAWVNAMLVRPLHRHGSRSALLTRAASLIAPSLSVSTKVLPSMGRRGDPDEHPPAELGKGHDRVSMRFGLDLIKAEGRVAQFHTNLNRDFRLLMTHGGQDEVCPIEFAREFYSNLGISNKEFREFPEHLHHLLDDPRVMAVGTEWLRRVLAPPQIVKRP